MPGVQPGGMLGKDQLRIGRHALTVAIMTEMAQECVISVITAPVRRQLVIPAAAGLAYHLLFCRRLHA
jgi:hypothetical protein